MPGGVVVDATAVGNSADGVGELDNEATQQPPSVEQVTENVVLPVLGLDEGTTEPVLVMPETVPMNVELGGDGNADKWGDEGITMVTQVLYDVPLNTHSRAQVRLAEEEARRESRSLAEFGNTGNRNDVMFFLVDRLGLEEQIMPRHGRSMITAVVSGVALMTIREARENPLAKLRWREICARLLGVGLPAVKKAKVSATWKGRAFHAPHVKAAMAYVRQGAVDCIEYLTQKALRVFSSAGDMNNHHPDLSLAMLAEQTFMEEYGLLVAEERRDRAADGKKGDGPLARYALMACVLSTIGLTRCALQVWHDDADAAS
eukprot:3116079-Pleurochrysis_carterae.AAC.2